MPGSASNAAGRRTGRKAALVLEVIYLIFNEGYAATVRRRSRPPWPVPRGAAARPHPRSADARGTGSARPSSP